jgi:hypothetical protein
VPNTVEKLRRNVVLSGSGNEPPCRSKLSEKNRRSIEASIPRDNRREVSLLIVGKLRLEGEQTPNLPAP